MEAELLAGSTDSAARVADHTLRVVPNRLGVRSAAIWAYVRAGSRSDADVLLAEMRRDQIAGSVPALAMAHALLAYGQTDSALV